MDIGNLDLSLLLGYKLRQNWKANLRVIMVVEDESEHDKARQFLEELLTLARIPTTKIIVVGGTFFDYLPQAPQGDLNIFGMLSDPNIEFIRLVRDETSASCIFVRDSGNESALA